MTHNKQLMVLPEGTPPALAAEMEAEYKKSLQDMMDGVDARPPQIKIAPGGANNWLIGQEQEAVKSFKGIILANTKANAYWHQEDNTLNPVLIDVPEDQNLDIPLCTSLDGSTGSRPEQEASANGKAVKCFGKCSTCYLNQFETAISDSGERGKGKACKNGRRLIVWVDGYAVPFLLTLPPTSILAFDSYITMLRGKNKASWAVWTVFGLELKERGKQRWSVFKPGDFEEVSPADLPEVYAFHKQFKPVVKVEISEDDFDKPETDNADFTIED